MERPPQAAAWLSTAARVGQFRRPARALTHQALLMYVRPMTTALDLRNRAETLARRFRALADEKRLSILELLRGGERCVCELTAALELKQSLLSFHLKTLKEAELVTDRRDGRWVYYSLAPEALEELREHLAVLEAPAHDAAGCLGSCCG